MKIYFELDLDKINDIQLSDLRNTIERAQHAHHTDIGMRIAGQNECYQADWIKHLIETHSCDHRFVRPFFRYRDGKECSHERREPDWDYVSCKDCGAIYASNQDWGLAKFKWFKDKEEAVFYKKNGKYPE